MGFGSPDLRTFHLPQLEFGVAGARTGVSSRAAHFFKVEVRAPPLAAELGPSLPVDQSWFHPRIHTSVLRS